MCVFLHGRNNRDAVTTLARRVSFFFPFTVKRAINCEFNVRILSICLCFLRGPIVFLFFCFFFSRTSLRETKSAVCENIVKRKKSREKKNSRPAALFLLFLIYLFFRCFLLFSPAIGVFVLSICLLKDRVVSCVIND